MGRIYLTTPIYYITDAPHAGTAYTTVNADALARYHRLQGDEVFFLTGTDEHGQKVAETAAAHGLSPQAWTDQIVERFYETWRMLDISNDDFIRTTEERHTTAVQAFLTRIYENGFLYKGTYRGPYCVACEDYYTPEQLVDGRCPIHQRPVIEMDEENWFFQLSAFGDRLLEHYDRHPGFVTPETRRNEALGFIRQGLRDISITRTSLRWGIPVPWDPGQVFYVWYDALINYLTAIGFGQSEAWREWWPHSHHLMAKEIIRFHAVWWPAMCLAAGIDPPHHIQVHGWLLLGGEKLSKTPAGGAAKITDVAPAALVDQYGCDAARYHLLREVPFGSDGDFSLEAMTARYNSDLANNLGNLVARVATVVGSKCEGLGPAAPEDSALGNLARAALSEAAEAWEKMAPHTALEVAWRVIGAANAHLEAHEPWKMAPGPAVNEVLGDALEALRVVSVLVAPAMPATAAEVRRRLGLAPLTPGAWSVAASERFTGGGAVEKGAPLFPRIVDAP